MAGHNFRGATVEDLDPLPALTIYPTTTLAEAFDLSYERSYSYLPVVSKTTKRLLGYLTAEQLEQEASKQNVDATKKTVKDYYTKFQKIPEGSQREFEVITPDTSLEQLEEFFARGEEFAVITDKTRRFVLGVATKEDLEKFISHRPVVWYVCAVSASK